MKVKSEREVAQSSLTLRDPMDCSLPGSSVHGIFQARILEWIAISFCLAAAAAKSLQLCPTLCNPIDSSPLGSSVPGTQHTLNKHVPKEWFLPGLSHNFRRAY